MAFIGLLLVIILFLAAVFAVIAALLGISGIGILSFVSGIVLTATGSEQNCGKSKKKTLGIALVILGIILVSLAIAAAYGLWVFFA